MGKYSDALKAAQDDPGDESPKKKSGKRSNDDWKQVGIYLKKETYQALRIKAVQKDTDASEIIEQLVSEWLKNN